jgi:hypothetical protein
MAVHESRPPKLSPHSIQNCPAPSRLEIRIRRTQAGIAEPFRTRALFASIPLWLSPRMAPIQAAGSVASIHNGTQMGIQLNQLALSESNRLQEFLLRSIPNT